MRTTQAIKEYSALARVMARTTGWALKVLGRNALRRFGRSIRSVLPGGKEAQADEGTRKPKWVIGYEPAGRGGVTIGFIATLWDNPPKIGFAATYFTIQASWVQAKGQGGGEKLRRGQIAFVLEQGLRANLQVDDLGQFSCFLTDFLAANPTFSDGLAEGKNGFLITFKLKGGKDRLRVSHTGYEGSVLQIMSEIENIRVDYGHDYIPERLMWAFDFHPKDEHITGTPEVQEGVAALHGQPIILVKDGWLGTSALKPLPGRVPAPKKPTVRRYPASVLD